MLSSRTVWVVVMIAATAHLGAALAQQQSYPNKPVRILTGTAGGGNDLTSRMIAQGLAGGLGQNVIVDARPTLLTREIVAKAPPDGYTLLLASNSFYLGPLMQSMPYDPLRDFAPVAWATSSPSVIVVHPSVPVKSIADLITLAKAKPGTLNYASGSTGAPTHLGPELFKAMAGVNIVRIAYKGGGPALNDLLGGQVQMMFATQSSGTPHVKAGKLRALAVTSEQPSALFPGLPTVAASGLPGFEQASKISVFAPAKTPVAVIDRLNRELVQLLAKTEVKEKFLEIGIETVGNTPAQLAAAMKSEMAKMGKVIKDAGIREE